MILGISQLTAREIEIEEVDVPVSKTPSKKAKVTVATPEVEASAKVTAKKIQQGELGAVATPAGKRSLRIAKKNLNK